MKNTSTKYRKLRGLNRRKRLINDWGDKHKTLDIERLRQMHRDYVKFWVRPWTDLSLINSVYAEPTGELETALIANLMKIYDAWDKRLKQLNEPYYLQTWLFENAISRSQIVCTIEQPMDFSNVFEPVDEQPQQGIKSSSHYNDQTADVLDRYQWKLHRCIQAYDLADPWEAEYVDTLTSQQRLRTQIIGQTEYQIVEIDTVWLLA